MRFISILTRRLKAGKNYEDFRRAWYHTVGFGSEVKFWTALNVFDSQEVIVVASGEIPPGLDPMELLRIDVKERLDHPLESVIEPEIGRTFGVVVAEDDFSPAGQIEYRPATVDGHPTDFGEIDRALSLARRVIAQASKERDQTKKA